MDELDLLEEGAVQAMQLEGERHQAHTRHRHKGPHRLTHQPKHVGWAVSQHALTGFEGGTPAYPSAYPYGIQAQSWDQDYRIDESEGMTGLGEITTDSLIKFGIGVAAILFIAWLLKKKL